MAKDFNKIQNAENSQDTKNGWEDVADYAPNLSENTPEARLEARRRANLESLATKGVHSDIFESGVLDKNKLFQELLDLKEDEFSRRVSVDSAGRMKFSKYEVSDLEFNDRCKYQDALENEYNIMRDEHGGVVQEFNRYERSNVGVYGVGTKIDKVIFHDDVQREVSRYEDGELVYKNFSHGHKESVQPGGASAWITPAVIPQTRQLEANISNTAVRRDKNDRTIGHVEYTKIPVGLDRMFTAKFSVKFESEYVDNMGIYQANLDHYFREKVREELGK